jgi:hypothetical protein
MSSTGPTVAPFAGLVIRTVEPESCAYSVGKSLARLDSPHLTPNLQMFILVDSHITASVFII